jgi:membrane protease YdiL (CAAX protease family)
MTIGQRVLEVLRAILFLALSFGLYIVLSIAATQVGLVRQGTGTLDDPSFLIAGILTLAATVGATFFLCAISREPIGNVGFADPNPQRKVGLGFLWGGAIVALAVVVPWAVRHETLGGPNAGAVGVLSAGLRELGAFTPQSASEEIFLRGYALAHLRRGVGNVPAVLVTGTAFGVLHLTNPNSNWVAAANISLVGIFLGALVIRTGSIWMAIGLHIAWNWFEGFFFGHPVSGISPGTALIQRASADNSAWTGGAFGPEASLPTAIVLFGCLLAVLFWRREPKPTTVV